MEMFGGIWAVASRETQTLIHLRYSSLLGPSLSLPNPPPSLSSFPVQLSTHSQRPLSAVLLQGIWFFNEDSDNDYGYFKTL